MGGHYLYQANFLITIILPLLLVITVFQPRKFMWLVILITLLRPNERFDLPISFPLFVIPLSLVVFILYYRHENKVEGVGIFATPDAKIMIYLCVYILFQTFVFHKENLYDISLQLVSGLILYFNIILFFSREKNQQQLYLIFVIACFIVCFEPLYYHFTADVGSDLWSIFNNYQGRIKAWGIWNNANETSFLAILGIASSLLLTNNKNKIVSLLLWLSICYFIVIIIMTGSRTGLACLFIMFGVRSVFSKGLTRPKLLMILLMLGVFLAIPYFSPERHDQEGSSRERADLRYRGIQLFLEYPVVGIGFNRAPQDTGGMAIHCTFIQAFAELGFIGGGLFLFYIYKVVSSIFLTWVTLKHEIGPQLFFETLLGFTVATLAYLFFGNQLLSPLFFLAMSVLIVSRDFQSNTFRSKDN